MRSKKSHDLSRRSFMKWSAAAAVLTTGLTGCGSSDGETVILNSDGPRDTPAELLEDGKWVTIPCPECPRYRCVNRAYMVDGIPIRQKTADDHPFSLDYPQYRACVKGRAMKWSVFSPDRLKYPMKRKNWNPGGGSNVNGHLRGKDEWVRISWKEALEISFSEFKRIHDTYGDNTKAADYNGDQNYCTPSPILNLCYTITVEPRFLNYLGIGTTPMWGENSTGGWPVVRNKMVSNGSSSTDRLTLVENTRLVVLFGCNHVWSNYGTSQLTWRAAKEKGAKVICIDPWFTPGNNAFVDEWIPCRPGTDTALILALAHELITHDENPALAGEPRWIDRDFLDNYTVGFDADHMPLYDKGGNEIMRHVYENGKPVLIDSAEFDPNGIPYKIYKLESLAEDDPNNPGQKRHKDYQNNFRDYVLGTYDNTPKNATWATKICGTPVDKIKSLAKDLGTIKPASLNANQSTGRHYHGGTIAQAFYTLVWMTGNDGGKGNGGISIGGYTGSYYGFYPQGGRYFNIDLVGRSMPADFTVQSPGNPKANPPYGSMGYPDDIENTYNPKRFYGVAFAEVPDAVLNKRAHNFIHGMKDLNIKAMIKLHNGNQSNQNVNTNRYIQAHRDVEFVLVSDRFMNTSTRYADIILPCTSRWEDEGHFNMLNPEMFIGNMEAVVQPMFEGKSSFQVDAELCKLAGADPRIAAPLMGLSVKQWVFNSLANLNVINQDGITKEPLIKFDSKDINEIGVSGLNLDTARLTAEGRIPYKEFKERGYYQVRLNDNLRYHDGGLVNLMNNGTPLNTETGKLEIYCANLTNYYDNFGFETFLHPIAKYQGTEYGFEGTKITEYTMQYINIHPHHRVHSSRSDNRSLLEIFDDVLFINPIDADSAGLKHGDTALLTGKAGKLLRRVAVTPTVMPGVIVGTEGSTTRLLDDETTTAPTDWNTVIDYGGNANTLTESLLCGQGHQAYNTVIVKMEKWTGTPLKPQYQWDSDVPAN